MSPPGGPLLRQPWILALLVFLLSWQAMTVAMMLPGSLPLFKLFRQANAANRGGRVATLLFLAGYATVWTGFAALAFAGDTLIHRLVDEWAWLAGHPWIIAGVTLVIAGGYQLTPLKEMCLTQCRNPLSFFVRHYRRGRQGAWRLGMEHGRFCLGCCWALMLVMFGLGVGNLAAMLVLATVMLLERTYLRGRQLVPAVGAALLAYGVLVLLHPAWLAPILAGGLE